MCEKVSNMSDDIEVLTILIMMTVSLLVNGEKYFKLMTVTIDIPFPSCIMCV